MYKVIMAPTEGDATERPAIGLAVRLAQQFEAELRLVRVESAPVAVDPVPGRNPLAITERDWKEARLVRLRKLESLGTQCRALAGIKVITALEDGIVAPTLLNYARRFKVDLIVMASHARGGLKRLTLGSVTDYLIRQSEIPVLVVKPSLYSFERDPISTFRRIVVALDGSPLAEQILPPVSLLAKRTGAHVSLLRVLTPSTYAQNEIMQPGLPWWDTDIATADAYLSRASSYLSEEGISVSKDVVLSDDVPAAILDYAARVEADLLAIGTKGSGGLGRLLFGSVADEITRKSPVSMLVFHPARSSAQSSILHHEGTATLTQV